MNTQVILAKKKEVCNPIMQQFLKGDVHKEYLCVVDGSRPHAIGTAFTVNANIQQHSDASFVREVGDSKPDSKPAETTFTIVDKSDEEDSSASPMMLLNAAPKTGRTHQIRVHALHHGLPIVGDDVYNPKEYVCSFLVVCNASVYLSQSF